MALYVPISRKENEREMKRLQARIRKLGDYGIIKINGYQPVCLGMLWQVQFWSGNSKYKRVSGVVLETLIDAIEYYVKGEKCKKMRK